MSPKWFVSSYEEKFDLPIPLSEKRSDILSESGYSAVVNSILDDDAVLSDAFVRGGGNLRVNAGSAILKGHFPGMPIIPGVVLKRLVRTSLGADLYHHWSDHSSHAWKTEFIAPVLPDAEGLKISSDGEKSLILSDSENRELVRFSIGDARFEDDVSDGESFDLRSRNLKDAIHTQVGQTPPDAEDSRRILQSGVFRFVTAADGLRSEPSILCGSWEIPERCPFVETDSTVPTEIVEESVAQIFSLAYSKSRNLPLLLDSDGAVDDRSKIFVFKSSVSEAENGILLPSDRLSVAIKIEEETERSVRFSYEAWNAIWKNVLRGIIEAAPIPMKLFKRIMKTR